MKNLEYLRLILNLPDLHFDRSETKHLNGFIIDLQDFKSLNHNLVVEIAQTQNLLNFTRVLVKTPTKEFIGGSETANLSLKNFLDYLIDLPSPSNIQLSLLVGYLDLISYQILDYHKNLNEEQSNSLGQNFIKNLLINDLNDYRKISKKLLQHEDSEVVKLFNLTKLNLDYILSKKDLKPAK